MKYFTRLIYHQCQEKSQQGWEGGIFCTLQLQGHGYSLTPLQVRCFSFGSIHIQLPATQSSSKTPSDRHACVSQPENSQNNRNENKSRSHHGYIRILGSTRVTENCNQLFTMVSVVAYFFLNKVVLGFFFPDSHDYLQFSWDSEKNPD